MTTIEVEVSEELVALLQQSRLGNRRATEQVRFALAIQLFQEGIISIGKAAELSGEPRSSFELLLGEMGIPPVRYDVAQYQQESAAIKEAGKKPT